MTGTNRTPESERVQPSSKTESDTPDESTNAASGDVSDDSETLHVAAMGGYEYLVTNPQKKTGYRVGLKEDWEDRCSCPDHHYNAESHEHACKHVQAVVREARSFPVNDPGIQSRLESIIGELEKLNTTAFASMDSQASQSDADSSESEPTTSDGKPVRPKYELDAEEPAERLQEAIPEGHDMRVKAHEGLVWIQTGQDAPGWAFEHYIKDPEQTEYIHEDHDEFDKKPGEWWKNAITPPNVEDYISEVLE